MSPSDFPILTFKTPEEWFEWLEKKSYLQKFTTAKKLETRARRMNVILEMLSRGEKFH